MAHKITNNVFYIVVKVIVKCWNKDRNKIIPKIWKQYLALVPRNLMQTVRIRAVGKLCVKYMKRACVGGTRKYKVDCKI